MNDRLDPYFEPKKVEANKIDDYEVNCPYCSDLKRVSQDVAVGDVFNCNTCCGDYEIGWIN